MPVLTDEQTLFAETARRAAAERIAPIGLRIEDTAEFPWDVIDLYRELGWLSLLTPMEYGGAEAGVTEWCILQEQIARVSTACAQMLGHLGVVSLLRVVGSGEQQARLFPVLEHRFGAFAASEPDAGSDLSAVRTTAIDKGGYLVVNGRKHMISNGGVADFFAVVVTVEPGSGARGLRIVLIDGRESPGVSAGPEAAKMGMRGSSLTELTFDDVEVAAENLVGAGGFGALQRFFTFVRPNSAAQAVGLASAAMEYALRYTLERHQFGRPVYDFQGVSFMIADMAARIEAARELCYAAAAEVDRDGPRADELASMAKILCTDTAMQVTTDAVQCLGGAGYLKDHPVERMMRDAKVLQIYEGTNQIQRKKVAALLATRLVRGARHG